MTDIIKQAAYTHVLHVRGNNYVSGESEPEEGGIT